MPSRNKPAMPDRPISPDPSPITAATLLREIALLRDQLTREDASHREIIETRLNAMDKAITLLETYPNNVDRRVNELRDLHQEKFNGVEVKFSERETRYAQIATDSERSIEIALSAAKEAAAVQHKCSEEAIAKNESSITKQIDNMGGLLHTRTHALDEKIDDLKNRMTSIESHSKGSVAMWGYVIGAIGLLGTIIGVALMLMRSGIGKLP